MRRQPGWYDARCSLVPVLETTSVGVINVSNNNPQIKIKVRRKFKNDGERKAARTIQNREAQQRRRAKIKLIPKPVNPVKIILTSIATGYTNDLYNGCSAYPFSHSITLTNKELVTLNSHNKSVETLIKWLVDNEYISNYIKTNEFNGGNYHAHVLVQVNKWGFKLRDLLALKWGNGFFRVVDITNDTHRLNAIRYCFKQIDVGSNSDLMQALADTWSIALTQTFDSLKKAEIARLEEYKAANGLTTYVKNIAIQNRA